MLYIVLAVLVALLLAAVLYQEWRLGRLFTKKVKFDFLFLDGVNLRCEATKREGAHPGSLHGAIAVTFTLTRDGTRREVKILGSGSTTGALTHGEPPLDATVFLTRIDEGGFVILEDEGHVQILVIVRKTNDLHELESLAINAHLVSARRIGESWVREYSLPDGTVVQVQREHGQVIPFFSLVKSDKRMIARADNPYDMRDFYLELTKPKEPNESARAPASAS